MVRFLQHNVRVCSGLSRRELLEVGGISALGLGWSELLRAREQTADRPRLFGRAKSCVVVFLFGGPGQQDLWDLKPNAAAEVRGEFKPIATNVPGVDISEQLPKLSSQADKCTIVRSVSHKDFEHGSASYTALTGHPHPKPGTNTPASRDDFPTYGAALSLLKPTAKPVPSAVVLGPVMHQGNRPPMAGQNAGFLGQAYDPFRIANDPNSADFRVSGLAVPPDVSSIRMSRRHSLLQSLDMHWRSLNRSPAVEGMSQLQQRAFGLLSSSQSRLAFDLSSETSQTRDLYGRHKFGQTMLLARRLVEAEVPLITVNWSRMNADQWDTHKNNYPKLRELLPPFDQGLAAFLDDMDQRGLLDSTLVICLGEFGRTPKINKDAGRDHWPDCYSIVLAGGGIRRGTLFGASDRIAAYPVADPVAPWDLASTAYHLLGIEPRTHVHDRLDRPFLLSPGRVVEGLLV
jgi:hypothetical protein